MVDREAHARLELSFSLRNLPQMDVLSKSDPFIAVFLVDSQSKKLNFVGRTETIWNNHDPDFLKLIEVDYFFEQYQEVELKVYDADSNAKELEKHNFMASVKTNVAELAAAAHGKSKLGLVDKSGKLLHGGNGQQSWIVVRAEQVRESNDIVEMRVRASGLPTSFGFSPATLLEFGRVNEDNSVTNVWRSEVLPRSRTPDFGLVTLKSRQLCNADPRRPIRVSILALGAFASEPTLQGYVEVTLDEIASGPLELELAKDRRSFGRIHIDGKVQKMYGFLDYIRKGCEISLMVAIDFTGSNGDPADEKSLHHLHRDRMNDYELAIKNVGEILAEYDTDNMFPVWGFGAKLVESNQVSHLFNLNWSDDASVPGVDGILQVYREAFPRVLLSGPTYFTEIIQMAMTLSSDHFSAQSQRYNVLLILTDGIINDMQSTIRSIVEASYLPLSIIIVGIGQADFTAMNVLDADDEPLTSNGKKMARDIVQFVPFRDFKNLSAAHLAKAVLEEVPEQFVQYCRMQKAAPMDGKDIDDADFDVKKRNHKYSAAMLSGEHKESNDGAPLYPAPASGLPRVSNPAASTPAAAKQKPQLERTGTVRECVVCLDAMAEQIILPCMHLVLCGVSSNSPVS
eukprot:TRINITY_DN789_c0_g1_i2.p1 TRINITY_DN789_c0_g1~~TRINITY_DN789_c0_g1_i2.p1  ORF type:complete len:626 (+),score=167.62 TRINITY_DN789_c0_g1_i2:28-1905(+)